MKRIHDLVRISVRPLILLIGMVGAVTGEEAKNRENLQVPASVRHIGEREATRRYNRVLKEAEPDIYPHEPELIASQRVRNFPRPNQSAWLLLHSVAEVGPRAHTPISQLAIVSEKEPHLLVAIPSSEQVDSKQDASVVGKADDAVMIQIVPGRFALAISHDGQAKIPGSVTVVGLGHEYSLKPVWEYPDPEDRRNLESIIYFVNRPHEAATLVAVRQDELLFEGSKTRLLRKELLYRWNAKKDCYERSTIDSASLSKILDSAERDKNCPRIEQQGTVGLQTAKYDTLEHDRALNEVYERLRRKLSSKARDALAAEQQKWFAKRNQIEDLMERNKFVADRIVELKDRTGAN